MENVITFSEALLIDRRPRNWEKSVYNILKPLTLTLFYFLSKTLLTFRILQDIFLSGKYKELKQGVNLLPLLFNFALEHVIRKVQKPGRTVIKWDISASGLC
jgi:hypothetical protein